jgi:lipid-A-disaccharide synthase
MSNSSLHRSLPRGHSMATARTDAAIHARSPRRIFITVAEVSGDQHAAHLIHSLKQLDPELVVEGLGGPQMRAAGAIIHHETVHSAAMGFSGIKRVFEMLRLLKWTRRYFAQHPPDLQICCDSPAMNFHFAKLAHRFGVPVLYYIAPQLWAWREGRMKKLRKWVDRVACILPFEEEYFRRHGVNSTFVGHPLFDELPQRQARPVATEFDSRPPVIGLLPGSRRGEAEHNFPPMLAVAERIRAEFPQIRFLIPTTAATHPVVARLVDGNPGMEIAVGEFDRMVPQCDLCITVSGTATLHVAGHHVPMLVVFRVNPLMWHLFGRWLIRTRTYSLVNLLADTHQHIVPEFIPWFGSPDRIAATAVEYLRDPRKLAAQVEQLTHLIGTLDQPGASMNVAKLAMKMMSATAGEAGHV